jgi:hypothetical protein
VKILICLIFCCFSFVGYQLAMNPNFESNLDDDYSVARDFDLKDFDQLNNFRVVYIATNKVVKKNTAIVEELNLTMGLWVDLFESFFIPLTIIWGFSCGFRY